MKLTDICEERILLAEEHVYFGGMTLTYQLRMDRSPVCRRFSVRINMEHEFDEAEVGTDLMRAVSCYRSLIGGIVTPCALEDAVRHARYA